MLNHLLSVSKEEVNTIMHFHQSVLLNNTSIWTKREDNPDFNVNMGSFYGAEICELAG